MMFVIEYYLVGAAVPRRRLIMCVDHFKCPIRWQRQDPSERRRRARVGGACVRERNVLGRLRGADDEARILLREEALRDDGEEVTGRHNVPTNTRLGPA